MWQEALAEITGALGANANERWHSTLLMSAYLSRDNTSLIKPSRLNCFSVCSLFRVPTHSSTPPEIRTSSVFCGQTPSTHDAPESLSAAPLHVHAHFSFCAMWLESAESLFLLIRIWLAAVAGSSNNPKVKRNQLSND